LELADHVSVTDVDSMNHGQHALSVTGSNNVLSALTVTGTGCSAVIVGGGNVLTLEAGNNVLKGSTITNFGRITRTYNPGLSWSGVGNTFEGNVFANGPHSGVLGGGVLCSFIGNTFDNLCFEATDSGAWYSGRSWTNRGNLIAHNTFSNIRMVEDVTLGAKEVQAIYLDDELSGTILLNNTCFNSDTCYFVGGGRDTVVSGNTCNNVSTCVHIDNRGMNWQSDFCSYNSTYTGELVEELYRVNYLHPPYSTAFPTIVDSLTFRPCVPVNVTVTGNVYCDTRSFISTNEWVSWNDTVQGNVEKCPPA